MKRLYQVLFLLVLSQICFVNYSMESNKELYISKVPSLRALSIHTLYNYITETCTTLPLLNKFLFETCVDIAEEELLHLADYVLEKADVKLMIWFAEYCAIRTLQKRECLQDIAIKPINYLYEQVGATGPVNLWAKKMDILIKAILTHPSFEDQSNIQPLELMSFEDCKIILQYLISYSELKSRLVQSIERLLKYYPDYASYLVNLALECRKLYWNKDLDISSISRVFTEALVQKDFGILPQLAEFRKSLLPVPSEIATLISGEPLPLHILFCKTKSYRGYILHPNLNKAFLDGDYDIIEQIISMIAEDRIDINGIMVRLSTVFLAEDFVFDVTNLDAIDTKSLDIPLLFIAAKKGYVSMLHALLQANANPNIEYFKRTPLALACESGWATIVKTLLKVGARIDTYCLHAACHSHNVEIVKLLLNAHANVNQALIDIIYCKSSTLGAAKLTPLESVVLCANHNGRYCTNREQDFEIAQLLLEKKEDLTPALLCACASFDKDMIEFLLKNGANIELSMVHSFLSNYYRQSPQYQSKNLMKCFEVLELLCKHGADLDRMLALVRELGHLEMTKLFEGAFCIS